MRGPVRRARHPLRRLGRLLLGRNELRRPADRIEGIVVALLAAAFLAVTVAAASFAGHLYRTERAMAARLRPTMAVLSQPGPVAATPTAAATARWRLPNGRQRSGTLTAVSVPAIYHAPAETSVRVWLDRSGRPVSSPPSRGDLIADALATGISSTAGAALVLALCYSLCRIVLDRHRLARWESAWAATGPRWSSRR
jgi:hypothetical protein